MNDEKILRDHVMNGIERMLQESGGRFQIRLIRSTVTVERLLSFGDCDEPECDSRVRGRVEIHDARGMIDSTEATVLFDCNLRALVRSGRGAVSDEAAA